MSTVTVHDVPDTDDDSIEFVWCFWISVIDDVERRVVFRHELEWHDLFCSGEWSWADIFEEIDRALK